MKNGPGGETADPFTSFRGQFPRAPASARQIANTFSAPSCERRRVLDLAEVDLRKLAAVLDGDETGMSSFAITRARTFTRQITDNGMAAAIALSRAHLNLDQRDVRQTAVDALTIKEETPTLQAEQVEQIRLRRTRAIIQQMLEGSHDAINLVRKPLTTITMGDRVSRIEHDLMIFASTTSQIHLIEIRDFPEIDGVIEQAKFGQAKREAAVALISLQQMIVELGGDPSSVSSRVLLVTPRQLLLTPVARVVDVSSQVMRLRLFIDRVPDTAELADWLRDAPPLPAHPGSNAAVADRDQAKIDIAAALAPLSYRRGPGCSNCGLQRVCRDQAVEDDAVQVLGAVAAQTCGSVGTVTAALDLAHGRRLPQDDAERAVAAQLDRARRSLELAQQLVDAARRPLSPAGTTTRPESLRRRTQGTFDGPEGPVIS